MFCCRSEYNIDSDCSRNESQHSKHLVLEHSSTDTCGNRIIARKEAFRRDRTWWVILWWATEETSRCVQEKTWSWCREQDAGIRTSQAWWQSIHADDKKTPRNKSLCRSYSRSSERNRLFILTSGRVTSDSFLTDINTSASITLKHNRIDAVLTWTVLITFGRLRSNGLQSSMVNHEKLSWFTPKSVSSGTSTRVLY